MGREEEQAVGCENHPCPHLQDTRVLYPAGVLLVGTSHTEGNAHQPIISHANQQQSPTPFDFKPRLKVQYWTQYVSNSVNKRLLIF